MIKLHVDWIDLTETDKRTNIFDLLMILLFVVHFYVRRSQRSIQLAMRMKPTENNIKLF